MKISAYMFQFERKVIKTICGNIVHYVPRRRMRVIAGRATMLAGDRS